MILGAVTAVLTATAVFGVFLVAPEDADQGVIQRIFYFHVPIALVSLLAFAVACVAGIMYLRSRDDRWDDVSASAINFGMVFSALTVVTGSIWAKASWGTWWVWGDPRLVTYLVVILLYAAYYVLRSSAEDDRRARYAAVYSIFAFAGVPLSFYSVRIAESFVHPVVFTRGGANMPGSMLVWFVISLAAMVLMFVTFLVLEIQQRRAERSLDVLKSRLERMVQTV